MKNIIKQTWLPIIIIGTFILAILTVSTDYIPSLVYDQSWMTKIGSEIMVKMEIPDSNATLYYFNITQYFRNLSMLNDLAKWTIKTEHILNSTNQQFPLAPTNADVIAWLRYIAKIIPNAIIAALNFTIVIILNVMIEIFNFYGVVCVGLCAIMGLPLNTTDITGLSVYSIPLLLMSLPPIPPIPFI